MRWEKLGKIYFRNPSANENSWWRSHTLAPTAIQLNEFVIRIYVGGLDVNGISRIGWIDVDVKNPLHIIGISDDPILDIGSAGSFDENGVFPAHAYLVDDEIRLYYTGFQLGFQVPHFNFGGLAIGQKGENSLARYSQAPIIDRADEGLAVRAGQSILKNNGRYEVAYSAGSTWVETGGKLRPCYDVYMQNSRDGIRLGPVGNCIIKHNPLNEHGLGRPQIIKLGGEKYIFYTRRMLGMKYFFGYAHFDPFENKWERIDDVNGLNHSANGFDSEMVYFPSILDIPSVNRTYIFYSGNNFGEAGLGVGLRISN